jgi:hypothetical protein
MRTALLLATAMLVYAASGRVGPDSAYPPAFITGDADPLVTQDNIRKTICVDHYTTTVRAVSAATKAAVLKRDGQTSPGCCEVDHFLSLEIGGSNLPGKNLWAQPYSGKYGARQKDVVETALHRLVCASADPMPLAVAQKCITLDWIACGQRIGVIK